LKEGLDLTDKSLHHYDLAVTQDPYSVWADYAVEDLENELESLQKTATGLLASDGDPELKRRAASLRTRIDEIIHLLSR
jgi:hypothetical protein